MRKKLEEIEYIRGKFNGKFKRYGIKNGYKGELKTVLLIDIKDIDGNNICDHLWFNFTKGFESLGELNEDSPRIYFEARSKPYIKGFVGRGEFGEYVDERTYDYKLSHPTKIKFIE